jgi:hypothetical protein
MEYIQRLRARHMYPTVAVITDLDLLFVIVTLLNSSGPHADECMVRRSERFASLNGLRGDCHFEQAGRVRRYEETGSELFSDLLNFYADSIDSAEGTRRPS